MFFLSQWLFLQHLKEDTGSLKGGETMTKRNNDRNQPHTGGSKAADTEFGAEIGQSKKARKRATRERKNNSYE